MALVRFSRRNDCDGLLHRHRWNGRSTFRLDSGLPIDPIGNRLGVCFGCGQPFTENRMHLSRSVHDSGSGDEDAIDPKLVGTICESRRAGRERLGEEQRCSKGCRDVRSVGWPHGERASLPMAVSVGAFFTCGGKPTRRASPNRTPSVDVGKWCLVVVYHQRIARLALGHGR